MTNVKFLVIDWLIDWLQRYLYIVEEIQNIFLGWNFEDMYG